MKSAYAFLIVYTFTKSQENILSNNKLQKNIIKSFNSTISL